ncbi:MAG: CC0125/CC1285 family lipoprotein [Burkholderiales bacterium]
MRQTTLLFFLIATLICGCATEYQPNKTFSVGGIPLFSSGGFTESQLDTNVFRVTFDGNEFTAGQRASDLVLLRSADIALKHNFAFFVIVDSKTYNNVSSFTTPIQSTTTGSATRTGNMVSGNATTTTTGGQTYVTVMPSATNTIVYFKEKPSVQGLVYNAEFICNSLGQKYNARCGAH